MATSKVPVKTMARVIFSGIGVTEMRGKIGNEVFFANRGGAAVRAYAIPVQPNTPEQIVFRNNLDYLVRLYQSLSEDEYKQWALLASRVFEKNSIARRKRLSAYQCFLKCNLNLMAVGSSPLGVPNIYSPTLPIASIQVGTVNSGSLELAFIFTDDTPILPDNYAIRISASPSVSIGIRSPKSFFKQIYATGGLFDTTADYIAAYTAQFAAPSSGSSLFVRAHVVNNLNGLASTPITIRTVVS